MLDWIEMNLTYILGTGMCVLCLFGFSVAAVKVWRRRKEVPWFWRLTAWTGTVLCLVALIQVINSWLKVGGATP